MKSIAVTKPDMGVLPRERLLLSPFGTLAQAFAEELLARAEQEEGAWSRVPLDLLEEGETAPAPAAPANVTLQVDLRLALEALRREGDRTEQRQAAERIVERVLQIQSRREQPQSRPDKMSGPAAGGPRPLTVLGTVRQEFHNDLTQNIHITQSLSQGSNPGRRREPGGLARQAEAFSRRLQILREEGAAFPRETERIRGGCMFPNCRSVFRRSPGSIFRRERPRCLRKRWRCWRNRETVRSELRRVSVRLCSIRRKNSSGVCWMRPWSLRRNCPIGRSRRAERLAPPSCGPGKSGRAARKNPPPAVPDRAPGNSHQLTKRD